MGQARPQARDRLANGRKAAELKKVVENELVARVKIAYAQYHQIHQAMDLDHELLPRLTAIAKLAGLRYGQGVGRQQEATSAEIEKTELVAELTRLDADRRKAKVRLNSLLGREGNAPISEMPSMRVIPPNLDLAELTDRAQRSSPDLKAQAADIDAAEHGSELAEKSWYPDIGVTVGAVKANGRFDGYESMLEINIPIRGDLATPRSARPRRWPAPRKQVQGKEPGDRNHAHRRLLEPGGRTAHGKADGRTLAAAGADRLRERCPWL